MEGSYQDIETIRYEALRLHRASCLEEAGRCYEKCIALEAMDHASLHGLGVLKCQLHGKSQVQQAIALVLRAVQAQPGSARYRHSLGLLLEKTEQYHKAVDALDRACEKDPSNIKVLLDLARVLKRVDRHAAAAEAYHKVTLLQPEHLQARYKEACAWRLANRPAAAADAFREYLRLDPEHVQAKFWLAALTGEAGSMSACPADMVAGLFDQYADHFDEHLVGKLGYRTPEMIVSTLLSAAEQAGHPCNHNCWQQCVDLGCGTGLMGPLLRPHVGWLAGVDLSARMVNRAQERGCYDELEVGELLAYMESKAAGDKPFDLLVAADVFVYVGDLQPVLRAAAEVSSSRAIMVFSSESSASSQPQSAPSTGDSPRGMPSCSSTSSSLADVSTAGSELGFDQRSLKSCSSTSSGRSSTVDYQLQATGRYAHSASYLGWAAEHTGWTVLSLVQDKVLRYNAGKPVYGNLCVLQK